MWTLKHGWLAAIALAVAAMSGCGSDEGEHEHEDEEPTSGSTCPSDSTLSYTSFGRDFLDEHCTSCHSASLDASEREGAPSDHNFDTLAGVLDNLGHIDNAAAAGPDAVNQAMPPGGGPTRAEREQLGEWIACLLSDAGRANAEK